MRCFAFAVALALLANAASAWKPDICIITDGGSTSYKLVSRPSSGTVVPATWVFGDTGSCTNETSVCCGQPITRFTILSDASCFKGNGVVDTNVGYAELTIDGKTTKIPDVGIRKEIGGTYHAYIKLGDNALTQADMKKNPELQLYLTGKCKDLATLCPIDGGLSPACNLRVITDNPDPKKSTAPLCCFYLPESIPLPPPPVKPPTPNVSCNCNSTAGLTPFLFETESTTSAYPKQITRKTVTAYNINFKIGAGKGEGAKSDQATRAEFQVLASARPYILGSLVNGEFRSPSWSKVFTQTARGTKAQVLWYKVPFEVKARQIPALTPSTAKSVALLVDASVNLDDFIPKDEGEHHLLYTIASVGAVDKKGIPFCPAATVMV